MQSLPVVDISEFLLDPSSPAARNFIVKLRDACHKPGFCYLLGHGIESELEQSLMSEAQKFFALPEPERREIEIAKSPHFRGYTILGDERTQKISDWRDQLDVGMEESIADLKPGDPAWLRLRGPNQWPQSLPAMSERVLKWQDKMNDLGLAVTRALALGLGQAMHHFDQALLPRPDPHIKIIRYPAQQNETDTGQGVGLHHDSGLLSFILQDDVGGLQVLIDGELIDAVPKPNAYLMNLGEMMQMATDGYLAATKHRVESPPPGVERISIAYFYNPRFETIFKPVQLPPELAKLAPGGQNPDPDDPVHSVFGENNLKIRLRAHPDVAKAHYSDYIQ